MPPPRPSRFTLGLVLASIGALASCLSLLRMAARAPDEDWDWAMAWGRWLAEVLSFGGGYLLAVLVPAVVAIGLSPWSGGWRATVREPGLVACLLALVGAALALTWFVGDGLIAIGGQSLNRTDPVGHLIRRWILAAGPMILGAWIALALQGRWRPAPTRTDRAGWLLGASLVLIYLYLETFIAVDRFLGWWRH